MEDERDHLQQRKTELARRRRLLQLRWDRQGDDVDPAVPIEIEGIDKTLGEIAATLTIYEMADVPIPSAEAIAQVRSKYGNFQDLLIAQLASLSTRFTQNELRTAKLEEQVTDVAASLVQSDALSQERRDTVGEQITGLVDKVDQLVVKAETETADRKWGQRRNLWLIVVIIVMLIVLWIVR
jgi:hypothetical protein